MAFHSKCCNIFEYLFYLKLRIPSESILRCQSKCRRVAWSEPVLQVSPEIVPDWRWKRSSASGCGSRRTIGWSSHASSQDRWYLKPYVCRRVQKRDRRACQGQASTRGDSRPKSGNLGGSGDWKQGEKFRAWKPAVWGTWRCPSGPRAATRAGATSGRPRSAAGATRWLWSQARASLRLSTSSGSPSPIMNPPRTSRPDGLRGRKSADRFLSVAIILVHKSLLFPFDNTGVLSSLWQKLLKVLLDDLPNHHSPLILQIWDISKRHIQICLNLKSH